MSADWINTYGPFVVGAVGAAMIFLGLAYVGVPKGRAYERVQVIPRERVVRTAVTYLIGLALFIVIDVISGQAITRFAHQPTSAALAIGLFVIIAGTIAIAWRVSSARS